MLPTENSETLSKDMDTLSAPELHENIFDLLNICNPQTKFENARDILDCHVYDLNQLSDFDLSENTSLNF